LFYEIQNLYKCTLIDVMSVHDFCNDGNVKSFAIFHQELLVQVLLFSIKLDRETYVHLDGIDVFGSKCVRIDHLFLPIFDQLKEGDIES
jgi:hypothetical protein